MVAIPRLGEVKVRRPAKAGIQVRIG